MICKTCGIDKDADSFYKNCRECKVCKRERARLYREKNIDRIKAYDRNRPNAKERTQKQKEYKEKMRKENPEKFDKIFHSSRKRYRAKYHEKMVAHNKVNEALRTGKLERPTECSICHIKCIPQGHHSDYSKPLDVIWVCSSCHSKIHKEMREKTRK